MCNVRIFFSTSIYLLYLLEIIFWVLLAGKCQLNEIIQNPKQLCNHTVEPWNQYYSALNISKVLNSDLEVINYVCSFHFCAGINERLVERHRFCRGQ